MKNIFVLLITVYFNNAFARDNYRINQEPVVRVPEIVTWTGEVYDRPEDHTTDHNHQLRFINSEDKKEYKITGPSELADLHHQTEKNYKVEIKAEKTPRFLFWGGNLILLSYKILEESEAIPHLISRPNKTVRTFTSKI